MNIKEYFKNKRNIATFTFILIITVILTLYIATSHSRYVLEKEFEFDLDVIESDEWNKRTLIIGKELNDILLTSGATQVVFGYEEDYSEQIKDITGTAVCFVNDEDKAKSFKEDDIKLYTITDSENVKTALILSKYQIKANADSSKMFYNYETLINVVFSNFDTSIVENMEYMFYGCKNLIELDLYKFETPILARIANMFYGDILLKTIYVSELWNIDRITEEQENVFYDCKKLVGGNGTSYGAENPITTSKYACIDTAADGETPAIPGYFTYKCVDTEEEPITFNLVRPSTNDTEKENTTNTNTTNTTNTLNTTTNTVTTNNETTNTTSSSNTTNSTNTTIPSTSEGSEKTDTEITTTNNTNTNNVGDSNNTTTNTTENTDTTNTTSISQEPDTTSVVEDEEITKEQKIENNIDTIGRENVVTN